MTTYSMTVSNQVNCFGSPADTWSSLTAWPAMTWGGKWGYGTSSIQREIIPAVFVNSVTVSGSLDKLSIKAIDNSMSAYTTLQFDIDKIVYNSQVATSAQQFDVEKSIYNSQVVTSTETFDVWKSIDNVQAVTSAQYFEYEKILDNTQSVADTYGQYLIDSHGFYLVFDGRSENAELRPWTTFAAATKPDATFVTAPRPTTTWS
jgi:hypothetical protein